MAGGFIMRSSKFDFTEEQRKLLDKINDPSFKEVVNRLVGEKLNQFVPIESGALRESFHATKSYMIWGNRDVPYAHYQWAGIVYGPNYPIYAKKSEGGGLIGFYSPEGKGSKYPIPGRYLQYTDPMAESGWTDINLLTQRDYDDISDKITELLKRKYRR